MKIKEVATTLERFAPLPLQESYDNAGLQIGLTEAEDVSGVLLCLDVTEQVVEEAEREGCNLIVAHHPLIFRPLRHLTGSTQPERVAALAIKKGIAIYAAHTNLDNADGGVSHRMARELGLCNTTFLQPAANGQSGSGVIGTLPAPAAPIDFLIRVKQAFGIESLRFSQSRKKRISRIALCGGAGDFLIDVAAAAGADMFLTGEIGYHRFFGHEHELWIAALGHYESERFTIDLMQDILQSAFPGIKMRKTAVATNPVHVL